MSQTLDADDKPRLALALDDALGRTMHALLCVPWPFWGRDDRFIAAICGMQPAMLSYRQREHVERVAWRLRRYLPAHLAPRVNPDDPIVLEERRRLWREMTGEIAEVAHD